jgi:hypothetical protein
MTARLAILGLALASAVASGCASNAPAPPKRGSASDAEPGFELKGSRIIGCCCPTPCSCRLNEKPFHCHGCDHTDAVHVDKGFIGKIPMDGLTWVVIGRGFGENPDKNWVYVYVTDKATDDQFKALQDMLTHDVKSWGDKAKHLAGKFVGMRKVPIAYEVSADRRSYGVTIPGILEFKTKAHVNPGQTEPVKSTGIMDAFGDSFVHADCLTHTYKDSTINYEWDLTGRQCNQADFVLNPERVAKGGIGWGCWTSHVDFGSTGKYGEQMVEHDKK